MIADIETSLPLTIQQLMNSEYDFQLTGSRFFGNFRHISDWDLFVEDQEGIVDWLKTLGFESKPMKKPDDLILAIFTIGADWTKVEVQIVRDLKLARHVQDLIKQQFPEGLSCELDIRCKIWSLVATSLRQLPARPE